MMPTEQEILAADLANEKNRCFLAEVRAQVAEARARAAEAEIADLKKRLELLAKVSRSITEIPRTF